MDLLNNEDIGLLIERELDSVDVDSNDGESFNDDYFNAKLSFLSCQIYNNEYATDNNKSEDQSVWQEFLESTDFFNDNIKNTNHENIVFNVSSTVNVNEYIKNINLLENLNSRELYDDDYSIVKDLLYNLVDAVSWSTSDYQHVQKLDPLPAIIDITVLPQVFVENTGIKELTEHEDDNCSQTLDYTLSSSLYDSNLTFNLNEVLTSNAEGSFDLSMVHSEYSSDSASYSAKLSASASEFVAKPTSNNILEGSVVTSISDKSDLSFNGVSLFTQRFQRLNEKVVENKRRLSTVGH